MAFNKRTWKGRQGVGLNKFSINGATPVTVVNQPDSLIEAGDALSAGNLNDLETRIDNAFNAVDAEVATKADETEVTDLKNALSATNARVENLEQEHGSYHDVDVKSVYTIPSGKAKNWSVNVLRGVTRAKNNLAKALNSTNWVFSNATGSFSDGVATFTATASRGTVGMNPNGRTLPNVAGHTVLVSVDVKTTSATTSVRLYCYGGYAVKSCVSSTSWQTISHVVTTDASWGYDLTGNNRATVEDARASGWDAVQVKNWIVTDLNIYFGTSDLSFLGATDSAKLATIQQNYPELLVPSNYGNSLVDTRYEGVKSTFKNLAQINSFTQSTSYGQTVPCNLRKGVTYTVSGTASGGSTMRLLKSDGSYQYVAITATINTTFVAEDDISEASFYGILSVSNLQIEQGSSKTTFSEYHAPSTLSLPTPITLRSAGTVAEEFDLESGEKTNPLSNEVNLTDLTWTAGFSNYIYATIADIKRSVDSSTKPNIICSNIVVGTITEVVGSGVNAQYITVDNTNSRVLISTDSTKTWRPTSGTLVYELATPNAPTQLDPIENPYLATESGGTISSILTDAVDDSMTLGYINL